MKSLKKILAAMIAIVTVFSLAGCGETETGKYIIYSDNSFAPFEFYDNETQKYIGVDMDILAAIAEDQGFEYEMRNEGFDAAMGAVQAGQGHGMIAGMTINDERKLTFDFSDGYFEDGSILAVAANSTIASVEDLKGKVVAAKKGTTSTDYAESIKDQYGFTITYFEDSPTMYQAVVTGSAVACFEDFSVVGWAIKNDGVALKTVGEVVNPAYYGFGVKKGMNSELIEMFNKGLANIKANGKYDEILARYGYAQ